MSGHTPRSWSIDGRCVTAYRVVSTETRRCIAETPGDLREDEHNAHLIVAAPGLLAACKALVKSVEDWNAAVESILGRVPNIGCNDAIDLAKAAIAKAEAKSARKETP